jgi:xylulokinase
MPGLDCGIDIGSTNVKVVFAGENGRALTTLTVPTPRIHDGIGPVTDPLALVDTLESLIITGWRQLDSGAPLRSICAAGIGEDGIGVTSDMRPTGPAIPWFDRRAGAEAEFLSRHHGSMSARAGHVLEPTQTAAKWLWLRHNRPAELETAAFWVALTDFPAAWWTGQPFLSSSLAPRTACFDVHDRGWIKELLAASGAPGLPAILNAGEIVGGVRKGPLRDSGAASPETRVVAGGHDHPIAAMMIRRFDRDARVDSMGTANLIYGETTTSPKPGKGRLAYSLPPSGGPGLSCLGVVEMSSMLSAVQRDADYLRAFLSQDRLAGSPPGSIIDVETAVADKAISTRRVLERASLMARQLMDDMDDAGVPAGRIYTTGGWSRSRSFVELRASIFGEAVHALGDVELTAMGAALFGAEAVTGTSICPFEQRDIMSVDPFEPWTSAYRDVYNSFREDLGSGV